MEFNQWCFAVILFGIPIKMVANHFQLSNWVSILMAVSVVIVLLVLCDYWAAKKRRG